MKLEIGNFIVRITYNDEDINDIKMRLAGDEYSGIVEFRKQKKLVYEYLKQHDHPVPVKVIEKDLGLSIDGLKLPGYFEKVEESKGLREGWIKSNKQDKSVEYYERWSPSIIFYSIVIIAVINILTVAWSMI